MKTIRFTFVAAVLSVSAWATLGGCTSGLSTQDAYKACMALQKTSPTSGNFNDCVACFERCDDCSPSSTPNGVVYACPGDTPSTTSSSSSGSSSASTGTGG